LPVLVDDQVCLRILALAAEDELVDETIERVLELGRIVGSVDDVTVVRGVGGDLGTKLKTEELDNV
jgi:hypothetical protein